MELKVAFVGFGNVARAFARILDGRKRLLAEDFDLSIRTTGIATGRHGCVLSTEIGLTAAASTVEAGQSLSLLPSTSVVHDATELIEGCEADVLFETSPLDPDKGEPATSYIRCALNRGINVVTANKGPVAFAYRELRALAIKSGAMFRFEGTVMDGAPVFNLVERCLPTVRVLGLSGVLNSTSNLILTRMEQGLDFAEALGEAQRLGIAEANPAHDIDGWDAAIKTAALANVLMGLDAKPSDVERIGISDVTREDLSKARASGCSLRLIARAQSAAGVVMMSVAPEAVPVESPLGSAVGTTNVLLLETDLMGELGIFEHEPGVQQTAYALLSDLLAIRASLPG